MDRSIPHYGAVHLVTATLVQWPLGMLAMATISEEVVNASEALNKFQKHILRKYKSVLRLQVDFST